MQKVSASVMKVAASHEDFSAFLDTRKCKNWAHKNLLLKISNYLKTCSASFSQSAGGLLAALHPELLSGDIEGQQLQQRMIKSL